jgi:hemoglobin/transferrin/lactoferrin receptor protein
VRTGNYTLGYTIRPAETPWVDFSSKVYYSTTENRQRMVSPDATYAMLGAVPGSRASDKIGTFGLDIHNTSRFDTGPVSHALTIGGDSAWDDVTTKDAAGGYLSALTPGGNRRISGAFIQDELRYGGWLRVLGALRYDNYELSGSGVSSNGGRLSPKLTVGVTPFTGIEFYGTYAEGYRAPSITETLIAGTHPFPAFLLLPNPSLKPETAHNLEAGVNVKYDNIWLENDKLRGKLTVFTNRVDNYIDLTDSSISTLVCLAWAGAPMASPCVFSMPFAAQQYQNIARARLQGVEAELAYDWGRGFVSVSGSAISGKDLSTNLALATVTPRKASATIGFRFLDKNALTIGARLNAASDSARNIPISETSGKPVVPLSKGYMTADLFASYAYSDRVSADLMINNVFNRRYTQYLYSQADPGLTAKLGITVKFAAK